MPTWKLRSYVVGGAVMALLAALSAGGLAAAQTTAAVTCPTVAPQTGTVTPAPQAGVDWSGCNLTSADLGDADLDGANLSGATLAEADLVGASLTSADLASASLYDANAETADMTDANLTDANLQYLLGNINMTDATVYGANISAAEFTGSTFTGLISGDVTASAAAGTLYLPAGYTLNDGYLEGPGANFDGLDLAGLDLSHADLSGAEFVKTNLTGADLYGVTLTGADLGSADLKDVDLFGSVLNDANVQGAVLAGADLEAVSSGSVTGKPASLPANWSVEAGFLLGPGVTLAGADMAGDNLTGADLSDANLNNTNMTDANLTNVDLSGDYGLGAVTLTGVTWDNTTCPDNSNSDNDGFTCVNNGEMPPSALPKLDATANPTEGQPGWYRSVTVVWDWTDANATINPDDCPASTASTHEGKPVTITATCYNAQGGFGTASVQVDIDNTPPAVSVTGVRTGHLYALDHVPAPGCRTTDSISGVWKPAAVSVSPTKSADAGSFTATCKSAMDNAGNAQTRAVSTHYTVAYGFHGFAAPRAKTTLPKSARAITVRFRLYGANGKPLSSRQAAALARTGKVQAELAGAGISATRARCSWRRGYFQCSIATPGGVRKGKSHPYRITALENVGVGLVAAPTVGRAVNPEVVYFR